MHILKYLYTLILLETTGWNMKINKQSMVLLCDLKEQDEDLNIYVICDQSMVITFTSIS